MIQNANQIGITWTDLSSFDHFKFKTNIIVIVVIN